MRRLPREYLDPADRRFHAQPNACPECGPQLALVGACSADPLAAAVRYLDAGAVVARKGIGGFHLACRADDEDAVARLRARKHREDKPFALMAPDLTTARELVGLGAAEERLLSSRPARSCWVAGIPAPTWPAPSRRAPPSSA